MFQVLRHTHTHKHIALELLNVHKLFYSLYTHIQNNMPVHVHKSPACIFPVNSVLLNCLPYQIVIDCSEAYGV